MATTLDHPNPPTELVQAASALDDARLDVLLDRLLRVRAGRRVSKVGADETSLLAQISAGPQPDAWARYCTLQRLRDEHQLTADNHAELIRLTDEIERYQANRVTALSELANLRQRSLPQMMSDLGIRGPVEG